MIIAIYLDARNGVLYLALEGLFPNTLNSYK